MKDVYHKRASAKVDSSENDQHQTIREYECTKGSNKSRGIVLIPGRSVDAQSGGTGKREKTTCRYRAEENFVEPHVAFVDTSTRDHLDGLRRRIGIICSQHGSHYRSSSKLIFRIRKSKSSSKLSREHS
jgi:hypothetical protein